MDILSIPKESLVAVANFYKEQFLVWWKIVKDPLVVISQFDLNDINSIFPALKLYVFVYTGMFFFGTPKLYAAYSLNILNPAIILVDFLVTSLSVIVFIVSLHYSARILRGRGEFVKSLISGLYLTSFLLLLYFPDFFIFAKPEWKSLGCGKPPVQDWAALKAPDIILFFVTTAILIVIIKKTLPVLKYVHSIGRLRAVVSSISGLAFYMYLSCAILRQIMKGP
jgi:hypothetical protein